MKKYIFAFFLFVVIFILQNPAPVSASCIKSAGGVSDFCVGYIQCVVGINIYCCDTQPECSALQAPVVQGCVGLGGTCHLVDVVCQTDLGQADCPQYQTCGANCSASQNPLTQTTADEYNPCKFVDDAAKRAECKACAGTWTAIGCIATDPNNLLGTILRFGLGLAGGIAFLLILFGGLQIMTSAGNPEQLNAGRELITSAIIGLILILFSIFLLQFIGVNIIGIPEFISK
jgi:hypothetical protein